MKYSLVNNIKTEAFKGGRGVCEYCGKETIAKCGTKNIDHWSHKSLVHCDNWWENETKWHRDWKDEFPKEWQEIIHIDINSNEKHIADVKTSKGLVIEFQNSPITPNELISREMFYKNIIWIVNGEHFKKNFHILDKLPNPNSKFAEDLAFMPRKKDHLGKAFYRYSENDPNATMVLIHSNSEIQQEIDDNYLGHHIYDWTRPRTVWFESNKRIFIDFGEENLWELVTYDKRGLKCVRQHNKEHFINKANGKITEPNNN